MNNANANISTPSFTRVTAPILLQALRVCAIARQPAFTWGSPGIGKSDLHAQLAESFKALLIDIRASQWDAVDTRGVPYVENMLTKGEKTTRWAIPSVFPSAELAAQYPYDFVFLDELNAAPPSVQAALYQLILNRRLGDYVLPENVVMFAAGNLETDRAVTHRMSTALAGRFTHFELVVDPQAWERWALSSDVHIACISYLRYRPENLHNWDAKSASKAQPTPRTWEKLSNLVKVVESEGVNGPVESALVAGTVGDFVGTEFTGFLRIYRTLPDPAAVIMSPATIAIPSDPATRYALCGALAERANKTNMAALITFARRIEPDFQTLLILAAKERHPEVQHTRAFIQWASDNADVLI